MNPNIQNVHGNTLLHLAAMSDTFVDIMKILLPLVDDLNAKNKYHKTPLTMAVKYVNIEIVRLLILMSLTNLV